MTRSSTSAPKKGYLPKPTQSDIKSPSLSRNSYTPLTESVFWCWRSLLCNILRHCKNEQLLQYELHINVTLICVKICSVYKKLAYNRYSMRTYIKWLSSSICRFIAPMSVNSDASSAGPRCISSSVHIFPKCILAVESFPKRYCKTPQRNTLVSSSSYHTTPEPPWIDSRLQTICILDPQIRTMN